MPKEHQSEHGLDLLIIDYLQLIAGGGRIDNRVQEMGEISRSIKGMARDFDIPVVACSQLSRAIESDRIIGLCCLTFARAAVLSRTRM